MNVALKEWAVVIEALAQGRQLFLLRKGGIAEGKRGFELRHREFLFFPTWEHQHADLIQPGYRDLLVSLKPADPDVLEIRYSAEVTDILKAPGDIADFKHLSGHHIWAQPYIDLRYGYRPDLPLFLVVVRTYRLPAPTQLPNDRRYRGCRSWVDLSRGVSNTGATPVLTDEEFSTGRESLVKAFRDRAPAGDHFGNS